MTTRRVVAFEFVSLDGVAEGPDRFFTAWDDMVDEAGADLISTQDAVVLGRRTYDEWAGFWPSSDIEPFATFINGVEKHVATSTPLPAQWPGAAPIDGGLVDFVRDLKAQSGGDIGVHGSISVVRTLLRTGLVDELKLAVVPTVVGDGRRLFDGLAPLDLVPIRSALTPSGYLLVDYRPAG